jgi:hypothetical protein
VIIRWLASSLKTAKKKRLHGDNNKLPCINSLGLAWQMLQSLVRNISQIWNRFLLYPLLNMELFYSSSHKHWHYILNFIYLPAKQHGVWCRAIPIVFAVLIFVQQRFPKCDMAKQTTLISKLALLKIKISIERIKKIDFFAKRSEPILLSLEIPADNYLKANFDLN